MINYNEYTSKLEITYNEIQRSLSVLKAMTDNDNTTINNGCDLWAYRMKYIEGFNKFLGYVNMIVHGKEEQLLIEQKYDPQPLAKLFEHYRQVFINALHQ